MAAHTKRKAFHTHQRFPQDAPAQQFAVFSNLPRENPGTSN